MLLGLGLKAMGVEVTPERVSEQVAASGPWGFLVFVGIVVGANIVQVPAWIFVAAAGMLWPFAQAMAISYLALVLAASVTFEVFGRAGGDALRAIDKPWIQKVLQTIDAHPIRGVAILRCFLLITPPVTVALAMSGLRRRDHLIGTAIGVVLPLVAILLAAGSVGELTTATE